MLGFFVPPDPQTSPRPWGHITCDGSIANMEGLWMARNLKFFTLESRMRNTRLATIVIHRPHRRRRLTILVDRVLKRTAGADPSASELIQLTTM